MTNIARIARDRSLVDRCVAGDSAAWDELYDEFHSGLLASIRLLFRCSDENFAEEVAARVWFALVANKGELLDRFDPNRGCRLTTYLATIAKSRAMSLFRAERRRRNREKIASRSEVVSNIPYFGWTRNELEEFVHHLTPREKSFLFEFLLAPLEEQRLVSIADTNRWKLSSRIQAKIRDYLNAPTS